MNRKVFCLLLLVLAALESRAQEVRLGLPADSVTLGEAFQVHVTVVHPDRAEARIVIPRDSLLGDLEIRSVRRVDTQATLDSFVLQVTTFALDSAWVQVPVAVIAGTDTTVVRSRAAVIPIRSLLEPGAARPRDLKPIVDFPRSIAPWLLLAVAVMLLAEGVLAYCLIRRRRRRMAAALAEPESKVPGTPYDQALARLHALDAYDFATGSKPFFVELTDAVRAYIEGRLGLPAMELTSRDLLRRLVRTDGGPGKDEIANLQRILARADEVKFADVRPSPMASRATLADAVQWIERVERQKVDMETLEQEEA